MLSRILAAAALGGITAPVAALGAAEPLADIVGATLCHKVTGEETLADLAILYAVGFVELAAANPGIDPWLPPHGVVLTVPRAHVLPDAPRTGIVINLADQRLYLFRRGRAPLSFPIGIGTEAATLRTGLTHVAGKRVRPTWHPPPSLRAESPDLPTSVPPGPDNPLGSHALLLGWPRIVIHGTNRPYGVGRRVSHGCLRLHDAHIEVLHRLVPIGTAVRIVDQPIKLGRHAGMLFLEVHPTLAEATALEDGTPIAAPPNPELEARVTAAAGADADRVDWFAVRLADVMRTGVPQPILATAAGQPGAGPHPISPCIGSSADVPG